MECVSNSSRTGRELLGTCITPGGVVLHPGDKHGDLELRNSFTIPGFLRFETSPVNYTHGLPLQTSDQGIYTCSIPDNNGVIFSFNVGFYTEDFNGEAVGLATKLRKGVILDEIVYLIKHCFCAMPLC